MQDIIRKISQRITGLLSLKQRERLTSTSALLAAILELHNDILLALQRIDAWQQVFEKALQVSEIKGIILEPAAAKSGQPQPRCLYCGAGLVFDNWRDINLCPKCGAAEAPANIDLYETNIDSQHLPYQTSRTSNETSENRRPRVMLIDDEPNITLELALLLRTAGYDVQTANSGTGAIRLLRVFTPDVLISNVCIPGMDGLELAAQVRRGFPDCQVILFDDATELQKLFRRLKRA